MGDERTPVGDPLLARLERLAQRRPPSKDPQPLPPPKPWTQAGPASPPFRDDVQQRATDRVVARPSDDQPRRRRRNHPAKSARIGALAVSFATTGGLVYFFADTNKSDSIAAELDTATTVLTTSSSVAGQSPDPGASATSSPGLQATAGSAAPTASTDAPSASSGTQTFDGDAEQTRYGPVEVQVQITDGALVDINVVAYPDSDRKSLRINQSAIPELRSEVLDAQSSQVDTISGATYTSEGYLTSLQSALDQARAAGATEIV